jgi:hypothetical protein
MSPDTPPKGIRQADRPKHKPHSAPVPLKGKLDPKNRVPKTK